MLQLAPKSGVPNKAANFTPAVGQRVDEGALPLGGTADLAASPALPAQSAEPAVASEGGSVRPAEICAMLQLCIAVVHAQFVTLGSLPATSTACQVGSEPTDV